jgi:hypothetical protein
VERVEGFRITSPVSAEGRVDLDPRTGVLRGWFNPAVRPLVAGQFAPRDLARELLRQSAGLLRWQPTLWDIVDGPVLGIGGARSVRFHQEFKGVPVMASEVVVNLHDDSRFHSLYNQYHYDIPATLDPVAKVDPVAARAVVARLSRAYRRREIGPPRLAILRYEPVDRQPPDRRRRANKGPRARFLHAVRGHLARTRRRGKAPVVGRHYLVWQVTLRTRRPLGAWLLLIDAISGALIEIRDLFSYATGRGKIFNPNPIVVSGDLTLSDQTPGDAIDAMRSSVKLQRLDSARTDGLHLDGAWVHMDDRADPRIPEPTSRSGRFVFSSTDPRFLDVMAYYHIDAFQQYLRTDLKLTTVAAHSLSVDPQGQGGGDASQGSNSGIVFGGQQGVDIPDATDAMVIVHEYGHALQDSLVCGSNLNGGEAEGFSDFLAAVYFDDKHKRVTPPTRGIMFSWNWNPVNYPGKARRYNLGTPPNEADWTTKTDYDLAELWSSATFELYRKLGGDAANATVKRAAKDLAIRLHVMGHGNIPASGPSIRQIAQEIEAADSRLAPWRYPDGLHVKVIQDTFLRRKVPGYAAKAVDVFIDDGRGGCYGSADGNDDDFQNTLWRENFTDTKDIWIKRVPYAEGAPTNPADHEAPIAGQEAHVYVQVKNRGTAPAGPVTVRVFRAAARGRRLWSSGWTEIPPPALPSDVPAGGAVTAGPFTWKPGAANKKVSLLAMVECALDPAVTQTLGADPGVPFGDLVPFDNNIKMRDVTVTA